VDNPPEEIIYKSLEVLANITVPVEGEVPQDQHSSSVGTGGSGGGDEDDPLFPMTDNSVAFALDILDSPRRMLKSRDREVFSALIQLHAYNWHLIGDFSKVIAYMCRLQPPEFVFVSFAVELEAFVQRRYQLGDETASGSALSRDLQFVSSFIQQMCHVLLNSKETKKLRDVLKDCIGQQGDTEQDQRRRRLFHVLLHSFSHNLVATTSLCLWGGAFRTASLFLRSIDPLDINLMFLLELDKLVELIERPLFRYVVYHNYVDCAGLYSPTLCRTSHLHVRMLENDPVPLAEGSGTMLFQTLKSLLMLIPQSTCYTVLRDRLVSTSRFRQSVIGIQSNDTEDDLAHETEMFVDRVLEVRAVTCDAMWETIRAESLETVKAESKSELADGDDEPREEGTDRREWLGYNSKEEERIAQARFREEKRRRIQAGFSIEEIRHNYNDLESLTADGETKTLFPNNEPDGSWKEYWSQNGSSQ
jgi:hypothetical protein